MGQSTLTKSMLLLIGLGVFQLSNSTNEQMQTSLRGGAVTGSITAGTATWTVNGFDTGVDWRSNLFVTDGITVADRIWATGWAYRLQGDTQEFNFGVPNSSLYVNNIAYFNWSDVNNLGMFKALLVVELTQPQTGEAVLLESMTIENISGGAINIDLFSYVDFDINSTASGDVASLTNSPDYIRIEDTNDYAEYRAGGNDMYVVTAFQSVLGLLEDSSLTNFDNTGLPFPAGDFTGGFQWTTTEVPRFALYSVETVSSFGATAPPPDPVIIDTDVIFRDDFGGVLGP